MDVEIPDAMKLLDKLNLTDKIFTGDAMFCQREITLKIVEDGGNYLLPVNPSSAFSGQSLPNLGDFTDS